MALVVSYATLLFYYGLHSAKSRALTIFFTLSMLEVLACRTQMSLMYYKLEVRGAWLQAGGAWLQGGSKRK